MLTFALAGNGSAKDTTDRIVPGAPLSGEGAKYFVLGAMVGLNMGAGCDLRFYNDGTKTRLTGETINSTLPSGMKAAGTSFGIFKYSNPFFCEQLELDAIAHGLRQPDTITPDMYREYRTMFQLMGTDCFDEPKPNWRSADDMDKLRRVAEFRADVIRTRAGGSKLLGLDSMGTIDGGPLTCGDLNKAVDKYMLPMIQRVYAEKRILQPNGDIEFKMLNE